MPSLDRAKRDVNTQFKHQRTASLIDASLNFSYFAAISFPALVSSIALRNYHKIPARHLAIAFGVFGVSCWTQVMKKS